MFQAHRGRQALAVDVEDRIFAAVLAELDGLGRLAPLLARHDVEDIHFEGCDPTMLRLKNGELRPGPVDRRQRRGTGAAAALDRGAVRATGRPAASSPPRTPILNVRLKGVTDLGARLQAAMDVLPRPAGVIRIHRFSDPSLVGPA